MEILELNSDFVVCLKPVGLDSEHDMPQILSSELSRTFFPVHRLDKNVAGIMVFAASTASAGTLSALIQKGLFCKEYMALCHGRPPESGTFEDLLFKDSRKNKVFVVNRMRKGVKSAKLSFQLIRVFESNQTSLVRIHLYTGRSHQIRVQFASRGFPLVGDHKYGAADAYPNPQLYACFVSFPWKGQLLQFEHIPLWAEQTDELT